MSQRYTLAVLFLIGWAGHLFSRAEQPAPSIEAPVVLSKSLSADSAKTLPAEFTIVIDSKVECMVFVSPDGMVSVDSQAGPVKMRSKFLDGDGKPEWKSFAGPFIYVVEGVRSGRCEIIVVPLGTKDKKDCPRFLLDVAMEPIPPPEDKEPDVTSLAKKIQATGERDVEAMNTLAQTYRIIAGRLGDKSMEKIDTQGKWAQFIKDSRETAIKDKLPNTRIVIADYFDSVIPIKDGSFDAEARKHAAKALINAAKALERAVK